ncbi:hypothetical protein L9F63_024874 [Diploptera punctata]|uniref:CHK kinase-like domain-containing protein n=1 Tax=Diploptera punctata TaxID=6984 RepID=A0AAD7ZE40_DIPPU|nr:hypothetical protein L9F63_024874 [Diploptera punctata]
MSTETEIVIPSWLNDEFLEMALRCEDVDGDLRVTSSNIVRATAPGDNYFSMIYRATVHIKTRGQSQTRSLIIKCQPEHELLKEVTKKYNIFEMEAEMLKVILPAMHKLLEEANVENFSPLSAKYIYSRFEPPSHVIVLEDLKESGFKMAERRAGLDRDHCMMVMRKIAQFHAASLVLREKNPHLLEPFIDPCSNDLLVNDFSDFLANYTVDLCNEIDQRCEDLKKYTDKIRKISANGVLRLREGRCRRDGEFCVLAHADLWVNNLMFHYLKDNHQLIDMRFVDFQICLWTSPAV